MKRLFSSLRHHLHRLRKTPFGTKVEALVRRIALRSYIMGLAASLVLGTGYLVFAKGNGGGDANTQSLAQVQRRSIVSTVKGVGKVTFASEQELRFNQKGTVAKVNVKQGDRVQQGQVIAELDQSSVLADIQQAALTVNASALQLQQLQSQREQTITDAQNAAREAQRQYEQSQSDLVVAQQKLPNDLAAAKRAVEEKQAALTQANLDLEKQKSAELQTLASTAQDTLSTAEQILDSFYGILTNNQSARPSRSDYSLDIYNLLYSDPTVKQQVENAYLNAVNGASDMRDQYGTSLATIRDPAVLLRALTDAHAVALSVNQLAESAYDMLQGAVTDTTRFTVAALDNLRTETSTNRSKAADLLNQIETAQANLEAASSNGGIPSITLQQKEDAATNAAHALTQAQEALNVLETQTPATLKQQQDALQKMQEDLQSKQKAAEAATKNADININLRQNDVAQKATSLTKARKGLQDYQLTAPFDAVVTHIDYKTGDNLLDTGDTEYVVLQNPDFLIVTIPLDQVDVVRVRKGMKATISFDALPGQSFDGAIDTIDPTPVVTSGVVSYNVSVKLPTPKDLTILSGMTATVQIETARKDNVLAVPSLALRTQTSGRTTVQRANGTSVPVEIGATDGRYTEILSGLQEGDAIVSFNLPSATSSSGNSGNSAAQIFRLGGGGGGFGEGTGGGGGGGGRRPSGG